MLRIQSVVVAAVLTVGTAVSFSAFAKANQQAAAGSDNTFSVQQQGTSFNDVRKAAAQGDPDAEYALGYMYFYGKGTTRDVQAAKEWIGKAAAQGQPEATKALQLLNQTQSQTTVVTENTAQAIDQSDQAAAPVQTNTTQVASADNDSDSAAAVKATSDVSTDVSPKASRANMLASASTSHKNSSKQKANNNYSAAEKRLLASSAHNYTVQLLGAYHKADLENLIDKNPQLRGKTMIYQTYHNGKVWYVLVHGIYKTDSQAKAAIQQLPAPIRRLNPWIKPMASVQQGIRMKAAS